MAEKAAATLADLGYDNVHVLHGDGTRGWPAHAPYDAIIVAASGPTIPESLKDQLKIGGRLVMPVGTDAHVQELVRVTRTAQREYRREDLADVRFVPLPGEIFGLEFADEHTCSAEAITDAKVLVITRR